MTFKYAKGIQTHGWQSATSFSRNSKIKRKVTALISRPQPESIISSVQNRESAIAHVFRADNTNCGDWWSLPSHYFTFPDHQNVVDINDYDENVPFVGTAIIGGGGLIGPAFKQLENLISRTDVSAIGWGLGNNMLDDKKSGFVSGSAPLPSYIKHFDLLGIRDVEEGLRWVPCASCMHPVFTKNYEIKHSVVIFEHKRIPIAIEGLPKKSNDGANIEDVVAFLGSGETVITNSYHGAYWATLLGRKCLAIPFSSKFYGLKHAVALSEFGSWKSGLAKVRSYPEALTECRRANVLFYADVMNYLANRSKK